MLCLPSMLFPPINSMEGANPSGHPVMYGHVRPRFHMVLEHTVIVKLRRCIEAVRFLTPICDLFFGIAVAIEHL
jgi:hypothetical protein